MFGGGYSLMGALFAKNFSFLAGIDNQPNPRIDESMDGGDLQGILMPGMHS